MQSVSPSTPPSTTVQLHKRETSDSGYWGHPGIATVTFCTGDPQRCFDVLRSKMRAVLDANPWIAGTLVLDSKGKRAFVHPTTGSDSLVDEMLSLQSCPGLHRKARYEDIVKMTGGNPLLTVQNGKQILKSGSRVTKLVVVVDSKSLSSPTGCDSNNREFSLIFSMSHVIADGHDYYKIFNMIGGDAPVEIMDPKRVDAYEDREPEWTGTKDFGWLSSLGLIKGMISGLVFGPKAQWCCYMVDNARVKVAKDKTKHKGEKDTIFSANQSNKTARNEAGGEEDVKFVSTNDVITSHFCNATRARVAMMVINFRCKIDLNITDKHAGCYEGCLLLDAKNYSQPDSIRKCLLGGVPYTRHTPSPSLPGFFQSCPMALITSWASFPFALDITGVNDSGIDSQILHLPCMAMPDMMDVALVFRPQPNKLAVMYLAKRATPQSLTAVDTTILGASVDDNIFPKK